MSSTLDGPIGCAACGCEVAQNYRIYNGYQLKKCPQCGFVFTAERKFPKDQYEDIYSSEKAYQLMIDEARLTYKAEHGYRDLSWFKRKAFSWLNGRLPNRRLLDLGSGPGTFLMVARQKYGYEVQGVEPTSAAAEIADSYGVPTYCGTVEEFANHNSETFDAITSFEVLEHLSDPGSFLSCAKRLLPIKGTLVVSVPNLDDPYCLQQQITPAMPPIHINFFTRRSLGSLLERAGFEIERTYTLPIPTSSVRNVHGLRGFFIRLPYLAATSLIGWQDGTTLLVMATARNK